MPPYRRTKIVATIGPATEKPGVLEALLLAGVDVVRLNFSHGDWDEKERVVALVRHFSRERNRPIAVLQDLQGPKIRAGRIAGGSVLLVDGSRVTLTPDEGQLGDAGSFAISYPHLAGAVHPGISIFIDDGLIELKVQGVSRDTVEAEVVRGGILSDHKGVNLPGVKLEIPPLTDKDAADLRFGLALAIDLVALSFVRSPTDASPVRAIMDEAGVSTPVIAKIEKQEALSQLPAVLRAFDGVMVARGDLAVELSPEKVPAAQKTIIAGARSLGKPVITATQMLESMTYNPRPTRAEASDVANAVLDGTDAVMLSGETAVGVFPLEAVAAMDRIVREAESMPLPQADLVFQPHSDAQAVCAAAVQLADQVGAAAITALTRSGDTARTLSALRPNMPILAFLFQDEALARQLALWHSVVPFVVGQRVAPGETLQVLERELRQRQLVPAGRQVVVVGSAPSGPAGRTNLIRLLRL